MDCTFYSLHFTSNHLKYTCQKFSFTFFFFLTGKEQSKGFSPNTGFKLDSNQVPLPVYCVLFRSIISRCA